MEWINKTFTSAIYLYSNCITVIGTCACRVFAGIFHRRQHDDANENRVTLGKVFRSTCFGLNFYTYISHNMIPSIYTNTIIFIKSPPNSFISHYYYIIYNIYSNVAMK